MSPTDLPESFLQSVAERRGRRFAFDAIDASRTALVVVDMQTFFVSRSGIPAALETITPINRLTAATRAAGGRVVWVLTAFRDWPGFIGDVLGSDYAAAAAESLIEGGAGYDLHPDLDVGPNDWTSVKTRYSAFLPEASDLAGFLTAEGVDTVLIAGTMTNICCETSARDAMMMGFRTIMVSDANATVDDKLHQASLMSFHSGFGDVRRTDEVIALLAGRSAA